MKMPPEPLHRPGGENTIQLKGKKMSSKNDTARIDDPAVERAKPLPVVPLVRWHPEITPGESFRVPAQWVVPHAGDFWGAPKHVVESIDPMYGDWACLATYALEPANEFLAKHWVYAASVGEENVRHDEPTGRTLHSRYLGVYRVWGLTPNDWQTGTLGFAPVREGDPR